MRLGYHTGYWSAGPPPGAQEAVLGAEQLGFDSVWTAEAYGSDAFTPLAWWGCAHLAHPARHGDRADLGPHADRHRDGRPDARPPVRRPVRARARRVRARRWSRAGTASRTPSRWPAPASTSRSSGRSSRARRPSRSTASSTGSPCPPTRAPAWARRCARPCTRCAPTCRSTSPPRARATSRCRPRSPTAGSRCSTRRAWTASTGRSSRRASPSAPPGSAPSRTSRSSPPSRSCWATTSSPPPTRVRPFIALYAGGMGAKGANFHRDVLDRLGYAEACDEIQAHYLAGDRAPRHRRRAARAGPGHRAGRHRRRHPGAAARVGGHRGHDDARPGRPADAPGDRGRPARTGLTAAWTTTTRRPCSTWSPPSRPAAR